MPASNQDLQLSEHFSLAEFIFSQTAARNGIDNTPSPKTIANMKRLCAQVLEPLRAHVQQPIRVSSGYRCPELNRRIGGAPESQHIKGEAADIVVAGWTPRQLCDWIHANCDYDQVIEEYGRWTHVSLNSSSANRRIYLNATRGGYKLHVA